MMRCVLCLLGVLQLICSGMSLSFMKESQDKATDTVDVQVVHSVHTREKRSTMQHPDILHLRFNFRDSEVQLNMTQKRRPVPNIPVYANDGRSKVFQEDLPENEKFAVFRDQLKGAVFVVEIFNENNVNVAGNFHHENKMYKIWPQEHRIHKRTTDLEANHNILPIEEANDMTKDILSIDLDSMSVKIPRETPGTAASEEEDSAFESAETELSVPEVARYVIEIGVLPDFAIYNVFLREANFNSSEALANLRTFYSFLEDSIQLRYDSVNLQDPSISITCWIKFIQIAQTPEESPWIEIARNGTAVDILIAGRKMVNDIAKKSVVDTADHYMFFTAYDLALFGDSRYLGFALVAELCRSSGISIDKHFVNGRTAIIAAHELAHNLNASHDGLKCNASAQFVMTPLLGYPDLSNPSNQWSFSTCSIEQMKSFLTRKSAGCARETTITGGISNGQNEGQVLNADAQCAREFGKGSVFCRRAYPNDIHGICQLLFCTEINGNTNQSNCTEFRVPGEKTSCGNGEWCEKGQCVPNAAAPARVENCPQGDEAGANCRRSDCDTLTGNDLIRCCRTCAPFEPTVTIERYIIVVPFG